MELMKMASHYHIHDLMDLIRQQGEPLSFADMKKLITNKFGERCVFSSCSIDNMDVDSALQFLLKRDKIK
jgi:probable metal-binding protein